jgi:chromosomal replication initiation ATPase DnaA
MNSMPPSLSSAVHRQAKSHPLQGTLGAMEKAVAAAFDVPAAALRAPVRGPAAISFARQTAMYLAHVALELSLTEVGQVFGRDRTTVAHACRQMEERREDPRLDSLLAGLEKACRSSGRRRRANGAPE